MVLLGFLALLAPSPAHAEDVHRLTLKEAADHAARRHPALATSAAKEASASARSAIVDVEGTPRMGVVGQVARSTGNVVPGATFAMPGVPGVAGPPGATRSGAGAWQSAIGVTASWDVFELVRRPRLTGAAETEISLARAQGDAARLAVVARAVDAFFVVAEARALVVAAEASAKRMSTFHEVVAALVSQKLRPELELARADADLAMSRALVERTGLGVVVTSARLAEAIGETEWSVEIVDGELADLPAVPAPRGVTHPAVVAQDGARAAADARASVARLGVLPRVDLVGAAWLRGGGYVLGGPNEGTAAGLLPDTPNWALGVVGTWTPTEIPVANARARAELADASVHAARSAELRASLATETRIARATLAASLAIAKEARVAVAAARRAVELATTRYAQALGNVVEVIDAARALAGAERDEAVARLEAWRALLQLHRAEGDLDPLVGRLGVGG